MEKLPTISIRRDPQPGRTKPWEVRVLKPRKKRTYFATEDEAKAFKAALEAAIRGETKLSPLTDTDAEAEPVTPGLKPRPKRLRMPVGSTGAYLYAWLDALKKRLEGSTYKSYEEQVRNHIIAAPLVDTDPKALLSWRALVGDLTLFGYIPIKDLTRPMVRRFYEDLFDRGIKLPTRKRVHATLSAACGAAVIDDIRQDNPCAKLGKLLRHRGEEAVEPEPTPFTTDEVETFLDYVEACEPEWLEYFTFLHDTGVRVGEAAALKWDNVDLVSKRAKIDANYSPVDGEDKDPKTHQVRFVDLTDKVCDQLRELRKRQRVATMRIGLKPRVYVFTNRAGSPRRQDGNMRRVFRRTMVGCKMVERHKDWTESALHTPHSLRDTFATTHLLADFKRLPWVSRQLGHADELTTIKHYCKFLPDEATKAYANLIRQAK